MLASLVDSLLGQFGYAAVFAFVGIESLGIPLPGETMLVAAALYAGLTHKLSIVIVIAVAAAGAIIGDNAGYAIGHWGGYRLLLRYGRYIRLHEGRVKLARYLFLRHGGKVVFFGRFISVLRTYAAFLAGSARMPWPRFLVFNATGGVVWAAGWGVAAYAAGQRVTSLSTPVDFALGGLGAAAVVSMLVLLRRREAQLAARAEEALPGPLQAP